MTTKSIHEEFPMEARRAIERAVWMWGVKGDACALLASKVIDALDEAGFTVVKQQDE